MPNSEPTEGGTAVTNTRVNFAAGDGYVWRDSGDLYRPYFAQQQLVGLTEGSNQAIAMRHMRM
jgi:hypothetical protein